MRLLRHALIAAALISAAAISTADAMSIKSPDAKSGEKPDVKPSGPGAIGSDGTNPVPAPKKKKKSAAEKQSYNEFRNGYEKAYALIYDAQDYEAGIITLQALHRDDHPDVANLIGYASRKLGRTEDAMAWYEKALAADPKHTRTWQYYGMWHLEMGDRAKAEENLEQIRLICGQGCEDYTSLRDALDGKITY
jgi:tetratricopeptide (TPR) repeat protein